MFSLSDQRIVVLGGSSGIGLATARLAAESGANAVIVSRSEARVDAALAQLPASAEGYAADLTSEQETRNVFDQIGAFDHLVYTAGENLSLSPLEDTDLGAARGLFETRLWGALSAVKAAHRQIKPGGSIVLMSGSASERPQSGWSIAAAICGAMEALTRALAVELAPIRVNTVAPGVIRTDLWAALPEDTRDAMFDELSGQLLVGRVGHADDVAQAITYLMADGYTTGTRLDVNGGALLV
jgi:NAD(P)-dependent dehydrogenase (short-subunit alcohol dehydrogenase family)